MTPILIMKMESLENLESKVNEELRSLSTA